MAETKKPANVGEAILGENKGKIGEYQEAPGGGTPLAAGQKAPSKEWVAENRKMQPRDENGQFTYNSANAKPLAYGPSRGVTVPPFLREVKLTYAVENKDVIIGEDGKRYLAGIDLSARDIVNAYKNYIGESGGNEKTLKFKGLEGIIKAKKGAKSAAEKEALEKGIEGVLGGVNIQEALMNSFDPKKKKSETPKYAEPKKKSGSAAAGGETKTPQKSVLPEVSDTEKEMAKNDPVKLFATSPNAQKIRELAEKKNLDIKVKDLCDLIASGEVSWGDIADYIEGL